MARRPTPLVTGGYYHVFNRGVEQRYIYDAPHDYLHFLELLQFYRFERPVRFSSLTLRERHALCRERKGQPLVEVICYCLMSNHYHLLLRQESEEGIRRFIHRVGDAYSRYFNTLYQRVGPLFQSRFKAVRIDSDAQLLHVSRYIHLNPVAASLVKDASEHRWSSVHTRSNTPGVQGVVFWGEGQVCLKDG